MITAFPKIFALGSKQTEGIFQGEVEITEKIDGSQIGFGVINGELIVRSKGQRIYKETVDKLFKTAYEQIEDRFNRGLLQEGTVVYGEYLSKPKHNTLMYDRVPLGNIAIYGAIVFNQFVDSYSVLRLISQSLELDLVPLLYRGECQTLDELKINLDRISGLGGSKVEGFVVKNYNKDLMIGGQVIPIMMGKYVSEAFKEVHGSTWGKDNTGKGKWEVYKESFCTQARWHKAIQHLRERGELEDSPKDIGKLLKEISVDIQEEERDNIKEWLYNEFGKELLRKAVHGFPEYYKEQLLKRSLES